MERNINYLIASGHPSGGPTIFWRRSSPDVAAKTCRDNEWSVMSMAALPHGETSPNQSMNTSQGFPVSPQTELQCRLLLSWSIGHIDPTWTMIPQKITKGRHSVRLSPAPGLPIGKNEPPTRSQFWPYLGLKSAKICEILARSGSQ